MVPPRPLLAQSGHSVLLIVAAQASVPDTVADLEGYSYLVGVADLANRHYEKHAVAWDRDRQSNCWNDKVWHDRFIGRLGKDAKVLDLGCGSGRPVAQHMVQHGLRVTGVDSSPTMISFCRDRLPDQEWIVADMKQLALHRRFDGILAWDSFFHLNCDDQRQMFPIFRAHAKPGAPLLFTSGPQHGEAIGSFCGEPLYHASLSPDEYRALFAENGFECVAEKMEDPECGLHSVWLARRVENG